jgi:hypothetical protein
MSGKMEEVYHQSKGDLINFVKKTRVLIFINGTDRIASGNLKNTEQ